MAFGFVFVETNGADRVDSAFTNAIMTSKHHSMALTCAIACVSNALLLMALVSADASKISIVASQSVREHPHHSPLQKSSSIVNEGFSNQELELPEIRENMHRDRGRQRRSKSKGRKDYKNRPMDPGNSTIKRWPKPNPVGQKATRAAETHAYSAVSSSVLVDDRLQPRCDKTWDQYASSEYCASFPDARRVYFHAIFDLLRPSSLPLLAHQVCRAMAHCIAPQNFRIAIHCVGASSHELATVENFFKKHGIKSQKFSFIFDTMKARDLRVEMLADVASEDKLIWQVDMDEFPDVSELRRMAAVLLDPARKCDVFQGTLRDRLPPDGSFLNITLSMNIDSVFPLQCDVKETIENAATRKVILYRSTFRPKPGNHGLKDASGASRSAAAKVCGNDIMKSIGRESAIQIDHFKYVWGVEKYLADRAAHFKKKRIHWHVESKRAVEYLQQGGNSSICTTCPEFRCVPGPPIRY